MAQTHDDPSVYYVPHHSPWPFVGSITLFTTMVGVANWLNGHAWGQPVFFIGFLATLAVLFGWFGNVISESMAGKYNDQVDATFRMGMMWFIFSEVMFFAAFFGALFYARQFALPWLSGEGDGALTNQFLWEGFVAGWPSNGPADVGGAFQTIPAWGLPLLNTLILLTSGVTITIAHHALKAGQRRALLVWLGATVLLGCVFLMGLHSTLFGPVKFAYLPEHLSERELTGGNGMVEMGTFVAILLGNVVGGLLIAVPEVGASYVAWSCLGLAVLGRAFAWTRPSARRRGS